MKLTKSQLKHIIKEEISKALNEIDGETPQDVANRIKNIKSMDHTSYFGAVQDFKNMAKGSREMEKYYPHVVNLQNFAKKVLEELGEIEPEKGLRVDATGEFPGL